MKTTCCFIGHRQIKEIERLRNATYKTVENLICEQGMDTFLFGSKSRFNSLCYEVVTDLKEKYPDIKRVYVRAEFPEITEDYKAYLLERYEDTYYPPKILGAGRAVYVERNREMVDQSALCIAYCDEEYSPKNRKSGTKQMVEYALAHKKNIIYIK